MRILGQVVEFGFSGVFLLGSGGDVFLVGQDEFPVTIDQPTVREVGAWLMDVDGVVQVDGAVGGFALGQGRVVEKVDALHLLGGGESTRLENGRSEINAVGQLGAILRFHFAGPTNHDRSAESAVVLRALGARGVSAVVGALDPAIVGDVEDDGVVRQFFLVEMIEQLAAGLIEPLAHGPVTGDKLGLSFLGILVEQPLGRVVRGVGEERRVPDEERFVASILDEVKNLVHPLTADLEADIAVASAALGIAVGHAVGKAAARVVALPPFAGLVAHVAALGQQPGQGGQVVDERHTFLHLFAVLLAVATFRRHGRFVAGDLGLVRV